MGKVKDEAAEARASKPAPKAGKAGGRKTNQFVATLLSSALYKPMQGWHSRLWTGIALGAGLLLIRKDGKLPGATIAEDYALEYGTDRLAMHVDACAPGSKVLVVDDLIATGGTALAAVRLVRRAGGEVSGARFLIDLPDLGGAERLRREGIEVRSLMEFDGH